MKNYSEKKYAPVRAWIGLKLISLVKRLIGRCSNNDCEKNPKINSELFGALKKHQLA